MGIDKKDINEVFSRFLKRKPKKRSEASAIKDTKSLLVKKLGIGLFKSSSEKGDFAAPEVDFQQIENAYLTDSYIRTAVDKHVDYMFKSGWNFVGRNQAAVDYVNQRIRVMEVGTGILFEQLLNEMAEDLIKYHNVFVIKSRKNGYPFPSGIKSTPLDGLQPVTGWFCFSPIYMQINRAENGDINSYQQKIQGDGEVQFKKQDVIHMVVDRPPGRAFGLPYLWEVLDDVKILRQLEELTDRMIYKNLFPLITYTVGTTDEGMQATDEEIEEVKAELGQLELDGGLVIPERHKVDAVKIDPIDVRPYLDYFENRVFTGLGVSPVLMGRGNTANRSTSDTLDATFRDRVKSYQTVISMYVTRLMIRELLLEGGFDPIMNPDDEVRFVFKEIDFDSKIKQENHAIQKFTQNAITHEELREELGMDPISDEGRLYFNMITAAVSAQKAEGAISAANNQGDNKDKPANQSGKKTSPGKPQTRKDSVKTTDVKESYNNNVEAINSKYDELKKYILSNVESSDISYYDLKIKSSATSIMLSAKKHAKESYYLGCKDLLEQLGHTVPDSINSFDDISNIEAKIERYFVRFLEKDLSRQIEKAIKETSNLNERKTKISAIFDSSKYRVTFILKSEYTRSYNVGFLKKAYEMQVSEIEIIGDEKCEICSEHVGKIYHVEEITDNNLPPYHTNCTCKIKVK